MTSTSQPTRYELDMLHHGDNCRFHDDGEFCNCGAVETNELRRIAKAVPETDAIAAIERMRVDAERYRWLRREDTRALIFVDGTDDDELCESALDEAIDNAMRGVR